MSNLFNAKDNTNYAASMSSTALIPAGVETDSTARPRNRRAGANNASINSSAAERNASTSRSHLAPPLGQSRNTSRSVSPIPTARVGAGGKLGGGRNEASSGQSFGKGLLEGSWAPNWSSVQGFASSFLANETGYYSDSSQPNSRSASRPRPTSLWKSFGSLGVSGSGANSRKLPDQWGPSPPPKVEDIAVGSLAEREAALKILKTASVLESYAGVNGGLDVAGKYKRRNSDENSRGTESEVVDEQLAYLHHVQRDDTYAGIVLRYRCREETFKKMNGIWSRDNIQVRKHLMIPVDACELKGRPCDPPNFLNPQIDHLATTPDPPSLSHQQIQDDFFSGGRREKSQSLPEEEQPWTHVRWVKADGFQNPMEIVRVSRKAMGFFPPRRKKSVNSVSAFSTPRHSFDISRGIGGAGGGGGGGGGGTSESALDSPGMSSRRQSSLSGRPTAASLGTSPSAGRSRVSSFGPADGAPAWMRRPGGVGTMSRSVRAPGPAKDSLNSWVNKRLPGFNIDNMPSMSVMGSESAHWGFGSGGKNEETAGIVESPFEDGRDADLVNPKQASLGLEQAAAGIETWLRSAWAKRPATPRLGSTRRSDDLDLIELADTNSSDDGLSRTPPTLPMPEAGLSGAGAGVGVGAYGTSGRSDGEGTLRGRSSAKGKKTD